MTWVHQSTALFYFRKSVLKERTAKRVFILRFFRIDEQCTTIANRTSEGPADVTNNELQSSSRYFSRYPGIKQDVHARSLSFNCECDFIHLDRDIISEMKEISQGENCDLRISMHAGPEDDLHNMIILQRKGIYLRPHKHPLKAETYHLIEGSMNAFLFNEDGEVVFRKHLSSEGNLLFRFSRNMFHMTVPTSDVVIFHESKVGPFIRESDCIHARWAPDPSDLSAVEEYMRLLMGET